MSEKSFVQKPLIKYAGEIGWEYITREQAVELRRGETGLFFYDVLKEQLIKLNPGIVDEAGNPVKYMEYEAFGETKVDQGSLSVNKKFTGKELDDSTGLYDYGARQYDARIRRFISADTAEPDLTNPQSLNRYSYCLNNPLKYIDPTGKYEVDVDELQPGDVMMQRVGTNWFAGRVKSLGESYAHSAVVLEVKKDDRGKIAAIRMGELRGRPENQRLLTGKRRWTGTGITISECIGGEEISDYNYFRVTNDPSESQKAVRKAEHPEKWDIRMETFGRVVWCRVFKKDTSKSDDKNMICSEYVNLLYDNKFHDRRIEDRVTRPSDIYEYQKKIRRPQE